MGPDYFPDFRIHQSQYPCRLYRIRLPSRSATSYKNGDGFRCTATNDYDPDINIRNYDDMYYSFRHHLNWFSKTRTHFISMFGTESHAVNWARDHLRKNPGEKAFIVEIDPSNITNRFGRSLPLFSVGDIIEEYPEFLPRRVEESWVDDEFVALWRVPNKAIMDFSQVLL